jgi:hypothetical protein
MLEAAAIAVRTLVKSSRRMVSNLTNKTRLNLLKNLSCIMLFRKLLEEVLGFSIVNHSTSAVVLLLEI